MKISQLSRLLALSLTALVSLQLTSTPAESAPTNFVIIMADDLGYADLSGYGNDRFQTPNLDRMAAEGMKFTDFHSNGNVCSPTRAALMTGQYQQRWGVDRVITAKNHRHCGLPLSANTLAERMRKTGYHTAIYGKWHLGYQPKYNPVHQGFDHFVGYVSGNVDFFSHIDQSGVYDWWHQTEHIFEEGYTTHLITQHAVEFLKANAEKPFCLYLPHEAPHAPYQGPNDKADRTVGGNFDNHGSRKDKAAAYTEMMVELDRSVGVVLKTLADLDIEMRTLVFFFSDNGANKYGNNGNLRGYKGTDFEGGHRVPMIARMPGTIPAGTESEELCATFDILPTILDFAEISLSARDGLDGISLKETLMGKQSTDKPRTLVWNGNAIRQGDWKLILKARDLKSPALFNLDKDLSESENVAAEHPETMQKLQRELANWNHDIERSLEAQQITPVSELGR